MENRIPPRDPTKSECPSKLLYSGVYFRVYSRVIMLSTPMQWTVHPARMRPIAALCTLVAIGAVVVLVSRLAGDWIWGALGLIGLFMSLARFFLPTRYRIDDEAAEVVYPLSTSRLRWDEVGCVRWQTQRALFARSSSRRGRTRGLVFDFTNLTVEVAEQLRAFAQTRTPPEAWK